MQSSRFEDVPRHWAGASEKDEQLLWLVDEVAAQGDRTERRSYGGVADIPAEVTRTPAESLAGRQPQRMKDWQGPARVLRKDDLLWCSESSRSVAITCVDVHPARVRLDQGLASQNPLPSGAAVE